MKNVLIDCDPGIDDAIALCELFGHQNEVNILGITTVGGNVTLDNVTNNVKKLMTLFNANTPIASGSSHPLIKELFTAAEIHGETGMDGYDFSEDYKNYRLSSNNAVSFLADKINDIDNVDIIATAPLTNIASFLIAYPELKQKINRLYIMGGSLEQGNITAAAEFNFFVDPDAAKIVFNSGIPITMSGLHLTENKAFITAEEIEMFKNHGRIGDMCYKLMSYYHKAELTQGLTTSPMHDICAVASFLNPKLFISQKYSIEIITSDTSLRGLSLADKRIKPEIKNNIDVLMDVDRIKFLNYLFDSIDSLNKKA